MKEVCILSLLSYVDSKLPALLYERKGGENQQKYIMLKNL